MSHLAVEIPAYGMAMTIMLTKAGRINRCEESKNVGSSGNKI